MVVDAPRRRVYSLRPMPFSIQAEPGTGVVIGTGSGDLTLEDAKAGAETLWGNPEWRGKPVIWDLRAATMKSALRKFASSPSSFSVVRPTRRRASRS